MGRGDPQDSPSDSESRASPSPTRARSSSPVNRALVGTTIATARPARAGAIVAATAPLRSHALPRTTSGYTSDRVSRQLPTGNRWRKKHELCSPSALASMAAPAGYVPLLPEAHPGAVVFGHPALPCSVQPISPDKTEHLDEEWQPVTRPLLPRGGIEHLVPDCDVVTVQQAIVKTPKACANCGARLDLGLVSCKACGQIIEADGHSNAAYTMMEASIMTFQDPADDTEARPAGAAASSSSSATAPRAQPARAAGSAPHLGATAHHSCVSHTRP